MTRISISCKTVTKKTKTKHKTTTATWALGGFLCSPQLQKLWSSCLSETFTRFFLSLAENQPVWDIPQTKESRNNMSSFRLMSFTVRWTWGWKVCVVWDQQATYSTHLTSNLFQYIGKVGHEMKPTKYVYMCMYVYILGTHCYRDMHACMQTDRQTNRHT